MPGVSPAEPGCRRRRVPRGLPVVLAAALCAAGLLGAVPTAGAAGGADTLGDPQPELVPFPLEAVASGPASAAVLPDGTLVLASLAPGGGAVTVCTLHPGGRGCASLATLAPYGSANALDTFSGVPEVLSTGGSDVSVVVEDCCHLPAFDGAGGAVVFDSSDDATSFFSPIAAGSIEGVDAAAFAGGQLVVASSETSSLDVQAFGVAPVTPVDSPPAHPNARNDGDSSLAAFKGGLLVASDDAAGNTLVEYAPAGANFNLSRSYGRGVGLFDGEDLVAVSGGALLTYSSTQRPGLFIRFFNGSSFGPRRLVPQPVGAADGYFALEETGASAQVFFVDRSAGATVYSESTRDGVHWSALTPYGTAPAAAGLVPALSGRGSGLVFETAAGKAPAQAQPVLAYQPVAVSLARDKAPQGARTFLLGRAGVHLAHQAVVLQRRLSAGVWTSIYVTRESPAGRFSFSVPGVTATYRAVVGYDPGLYLYGYSNEVTLTAVPTKKKS